MKKPEIVAPAGNWIMLRAAVGAGADAVYFGTKELNMRASAENFSLKELPKVVSFCKKHGVKTHLTLNSIVFDNEFAKLDKTLCIAKKSGIDMIIAWDMAVVKRALEMQLPICLSTQASVSNSKSAEFFKGIGVQRIVPARECSLKQIANIKKTGVEVEIFVHGAMCVSISGRCFMSHYLFNKSANRGDCLQPCRYEYSIYNKELDKDLLIEKNYVMSPKDLCTLPFIEKLIKADVNAFKIEGRRRSPEYVAVVTGCYKKAVDLYSQKKLTAKAKQGLMKNLGTVFNRGFSSGFYLGQPGSEDFANTRGSMASTRKDYIGKVIYFDKKSKEATIKIESGGIKAGELLIVQGKNSGALNQKLNNIRIGNDNVKSANKSDVVYIKTMAEVEKDDKVFVIRSC